MRHPPESPARRAPTWRVRAALLEVLETVEPLTVPPTRPGSETDQPALVTALADIEPDQLADVGGKAANLGELVRGGCRCRPASA